MGKYTGMPCSQCSHTFLEGDDIVVCPICGAPHHRSCYREKGNCVMEKEHETEGYIWQMPLDTPSVATVICGSCQAKNFPESAFCCSCSARLDLNPEISLDKKPTHAGDKYPSQVYKATPNTNNAQTNEQWSVDGVTAREISTYIGQSGSPYFLSKFQKLVKSKNGAGWNWPAFFFNYIYFFYRRMYKEGFIILGAYLLLSAPTVNLPMERMLTVVGVLNIVLSVGCGFLANKIYFKKVIREIKGIRENGNAPAGGRDYYAILQMRGKPDMVSIMVAVGIYFVIYSFTGSYLAEITGLL